MLPTLGRFLSEVAFPLRRHAKRVPLDVPMIAEALREAEVFAAGKEPHEPAALFFACSRRALAFGGAGAAYLVLPVVTRSQARAVGLELRAEDIALGVHHLRILRGEMDFDELRAWFTIHLAPAGAPTG
jgi:hypothetical protein